jgi:hypothetical protein
LNAEGVFLQAAGSKSPRASQQPKGLTPKKRRKERKEEKK